MHVRHAVHRRYHTAVFHAVAAGAICLIVGVTVLFWGVTHLGFQPAADGTVVAIAPNTAASRAGLQVGDQIIHVYDTPFTAFEQQHDDLAAVLTPVTTVPLVILRGDEQIALSLDKRTLVWGFQRQKLETFVVAFVCWMTGVVFVAVRNTLPHRYVFGVFWILVSIIVGCATFAAYSVKSLNLILNVAIPFVVQLGVSTYLYYPVTLFPNRQQVTRALFAAWFVVNVGVVLTLLAQRPWTSVLAVLQNLNTLSIVLGLVVALVLALLGARRGRVERTKRANRLIISSIGVSLLLFTAYKILRTVFPGYSFFSISSAVFFLPVPLTYLAMVLLADTYYVDKYVYWAFSNLVVLLLFLVLFAVINAWIGFATVTSALWFALVSVVLYRPLSLLVQSALSQLFFSGQQARAAAHQTFAPFPYLRDPHEIAAALATYIAETFNQPKIALYTAGPGADTLHLLHTTHNDNLPIDLPRNQLPRLFASRKHAIIASDTVVDELARANGDVGQIIPLTHTFQLWCVLSTSEDVVALMLLGQRGNFEPYRRADLIMLHQVVNVAALAFANSHAYVAACAANDTIRALYRRVQQAQDDVLRDIAINLHDEVINYGVRLNIDALQTLLLTVQDATLRHELQLLLDTERATAEALRIVCEHLHPTASDDPRGLGSVLRHHLERIRHAWTGQCVLRIEQPVCDIDPTVQREAVRIVREAVTNAIKHAHQATTITTTLRYPCGGSRWFHLTIVDDGQAVVTRYHRPQHVGVGNMIECARSIGGTVTIQQGRDGGTVVHATLPTQLPQMEDG